MGWEPSFELEFTLEFTQNSEKTVKKNTRTTPCLLLFVVITANQQTKKCFGHAHRRLITSGSACAHLPGLDQSGRPTVSVREGEGLCVTASEQQQQRPDPHEDVSLWSGNQSDFSHSVPVLHWRHLSCQRWWNRESHWIFKGVMSRFVLYFILAFIYLLFLSEWRL